MLQNENQVPVSKSLVVRASEQHPTGSGSNPSRSEFTELMLKKKSPRRQKPRFEDFFFLSMIKVVFYLNYNVFGEVFPRQIKFF